MRFLTIATTVALGALAIPGAAFATHGGPGRNCAPPPGKTTTTVTDGSKTVTVNRVVLSGPYIVKAGACADFNAGKWFFTYRFDGATVEAAVGDDPATGAGDPGMIPSQPDMYAVVDGDDDSTDPIGVSGGYVGVSNWETSSGRVSQAQCQASGPNNGTPASSNSGGCVGVAFGPWVYVPGDLPTPICGNSSGNAWDGSGSSGPHHRDGCSVP